LQQTQAEEHTIDHIERAFIASSIFSLSNPNNPSSISNLDLTIGQQGSSVAESPFLPGPSNKTGGGNNEDNSTVRVHGDQTSVQVYGSNDNNASHPSDEQQETDLDTTAVLEYLWFTAPSITLNFEQLLQQSLSSNQFQNSNEEDDDATSNISNSSISSTLEQLLLNYKSLSDDIKKQLMATAISTNNEMLLKELLMHAEKHKVQEIKYEEN
jgi:hypothetical protein